jgi:TfoX/Sxy family transcriptional regulator of competence genes
MPYDQKLASRVREMILLTHQNIIEKAMFGGLCFMVNDKMCVGVEADRLMIRLNPDKYDEVMEMDGCHPMDFTGRVMKGYVFVDKEMLTRKKELVFWINLALEYNAIARVSKKKKKKSKAD